MSYASWFLHDRLLFFFPCLLTKGGWRARHGRVSLGLPAGRGWKVELAREDIPMARTKWSRISGWRQGAWPFISHELTIDPC